MSKELRAKRKHLYEENKKYGYRATPFECPQMGNRFAAWRSRDFLVQGFNDPDGVIRLSVCRTALDATGGWQDGILWDDLQRLKRDCGYGDRQAVEIYPPDDEVVNVANIRHLWILPEPIKPTLRGDT